MMKREIVETPRFQSQYRKFVRRYPFLKQRISETLQKMRDDVFAPEFKSHKLHGNMHGIFSCSCGYDCRIVFTIEQSGDSEAIILDSIGTHRQVY